MMVENHNSVKAKAYSVSAIMKNPNLLKEIETALNSPVKSTKRKKVSSMMKSVSIVSKNKYDGMGGKGLIPGALSAIGSGAKWIWDKNVEATKKRWDTTKKVASATAKVGTAAAKQAGDLTMLGAATAQGRLAQAPAATGQALWGDLVPGPKPFEETWGGKIVDTYSKGMQPSKMAVVNGVSGPTSQLKQPVSYVKDGPGGATAPTAKPGAVGYNVGATATAVNPFAKFFQPAQTATTVKGKTTGAPGTATAKTAGAPLTSFSGLAQFMPQKGAPKYNTSNVNINLTGGDYTGGTSGVSYDTGAPGIDMAGLAATGGILTSSSESPDTTGGTTGTGEAALNGIKSYTAKKLAEAQASGVGSATWVAQAMSDPEVLKEMGYWDTLKSEFFKGIPDDELPIGASLTRQVAKLSEVLKKEKGLDSKLSNLETLKTRGATVEDDMTSYIREKDEYIETLDTMLDKAKETYTQGDMSNPYVSGRMKNYISYLTTLKGRQNQRYVGFLNTSIDEYNKELTASQDDYNKTAELFNSELQTKSTILQEDYNRMIKMLEDMYGNLQGQEVTLDGMSKDEWELVKLKADTQKSVNSALGIEVGADKTKPLTQDERDRFWALMGKTNEAGRSGTDVATGKSSIVQAAPTDFYGTLSRLETEGYDSSRFKPTFFENANLDAYSKAKSGGLDSALAYFNKAKADMTGYVNAGYIDKDTYASDLNSLKTAVVGGISKGMSEGLAEPNSVANIRKALTDLTTGGLFGKAWTTDEASRTNFIKKYSGVIGKDVLNGIFSSYAMAVNTDPRAAKAFYQPAVSDDTLVSNLVNILSATLSQDLQ